MSSLDGLVPKSVVAAWNWPNNPKPAKKIETKPTPKPAAKTEAKPAKPKFERKKISITAPNTMLGVHQSVHKMRYKSYYSVSKTLLLAPIAGVFFLSGSYIIALLAAVVASYYYGQFKQVRERYAGIKKRAVIVPDTLLYDRFPVRIPLDTLHEKLKPSAPPTIFD